MVKDPNQILNDIEKFLTDAVRNNDCLEVEEVDTAQIVQQISDNLAKKRFIWLGNETYVPNKLVGQLPLHDPDKLEELEVIFNSPILMKLMTQYINSREFKMFDALKIEIKYTPEQDTNKKFFVEFAWPTEEEAVEDITIKVDEDQGRILEVYSLKPEIPRLARLSSLNGEVYRENYLITKQRTNIGRLRNVLDRDAGKLIRHNDFIYSRILDDNSPNNSVSRQHATITFQDGKFIVHDNGSANGTAIERAGIAPIEVLPGNPKGVVLEHYDIIRFGTALVRFEDNAQIGLTLDKDVVQPQLSEIEHASEIRTTIKLTKEQIEAEMRKLLDSE